MKHTLQAGFREVFEKNGSIMLLIEPTSGQIVEANSGAVAYYGYPLKNMIGMSMTQITTLAWDEVVERKRTLCSERNLFRCRHRLASGEERDVEVYCSYVNWNSKPQLLFSIVHDVTPLKEVREELKASGAVYRTAFQMSLDGVSISRSSDGMFIDVNRAFLETIGYSREEVVGRTSSEIDIWVQSNGRRRLAGTPPLKSPCRNKEIKLRKKGGEIIWCLASISEIEMDGSPYLLSVFKNVSGLKEAQERINVLAFYDPLTNLPNRRLLLDRLKKTQGEVARSHRNQALLFVDLDDFRTLNDSFGHQAGDLLLKEVVKRLRSCTRKTDTIARLGGDKFAVILRDLSIVAEEAASQAKAVADKILAKNGEPYLLDNHECQISLCIGIVIFGDGKQGGNDILQRAECGMFQAKETGRNTISFFSPVLQAAASARATMEEELRRAIKSNQFVLFYQPQIEAARLMGAEALVRWNHPTRGLLAPAEFIPLAEESGLMPVLGSLLLESACKQIAAWASSKRMAEIVVAVNISACQFKHSDFVDQVLVTLSRTGAEPQFLNLELTESLMVHNIEDVIAKIERLRAHGLRFSLDDFGTGYSSLAYLKRMPLDKLKIDRSFVRDILTDKNSAAIAQTIISLGRAMGMAVIAEGVETVEQRDLLAALGCHSFQGFLFSRPLPLGEFERLWLDSADRRLPAYTPGSNEEDCGL